MIRKFLSETKRGCARYLLAWSEVAADEARGCGMCHGKGRRWFDDAELKRAVRAEFTRMRSRNSPPISPEYDGPVGG